jgi:replicative DNA helicase
MDDMDDPLQSLSGILAHADDKLRSGTSASATVWATGFPALDEQLAGGFRSGELVLLAGPQGIGKTTLALQLLRNAAVRGQPALYFSFEHDGQLVLERLIALETPSASEFGEPSASLADIRRAFGAGDGSTRPLADRLAEHSGGFEALEAVQKYAERLHVYSSTGSATSVGTIKEVAQRVGTDAGMQPLVVVDYLQRVHAPGGMIAEDERVTTVVEGLKELALGLDVPVLSVVAADREGITTGRRLRIQHLRGSSALAYEADVVLIINDKFDVVARHHLVYDVGNIERFREWVVLTIEKNRSGKDKVDLEFRKRFDQSRFDVDGSPVVEQLVDDRVFVR